MRITVHLSSYYDWEKVPEGVKVTEADVKAKIAKPAQDGGWLMKVSKRGDTHTGVCLPESELIMQIIQDSVRENVALSRPEAMAHYLARHVMPHHAHRSWMKKFEVHDDGPDPKLFAKMIDEQVAGGNLTEEDRELLEEAYMRSPKTEQRHEEHVAHLHRRFGVKKA